MSIWQGLTALGVIAAIAGVVFMRLMKKNPKAKEFISEVMEKKPQISKLQTPDVIQQVYDEKRTMM